MAATDNGALEFDVVMDNGKLTVAINEAQKKIEGFADGTVKAGESMDEMFDITTENVKIQKKVIADLEKQIKKLDKEISKLSPGKAQAQLEHEALEARKELEAEKDALTMMEDQLNTTGKATVNFRTRIRHLRDELVMMEAAGKRNTKEYEDLRAEMANLVDAVGDATQQANILAHDQAALQGYISGLTGIAGGFTAVQGAMSLVVGENENLQKIMLKVQALMSITIGLQQVEQTLNKDSAFMVKTIGDLKKWWTGVTAAATAATTAETAATAANTAAATAGTVANTGLAGSFRLIGVAIKSIPVFGWIAAAIGAIITAVGIMAHKSKKAKEEMAAAREEAEKAREAEKAKMDSLAKDYGNQVAEVESLRAALRSEKLAYEDKVKVINKLRDIIPDYNAKLSKEGKVIGENKKALDDYLLSLDKSLRYKAAMEELTEIYADIYKMDRKGFGPELSIVGPGAGDMSYIEYSEKRLEQMGLKGQPDIPSMVMDAIKKEYDQIQQGIQEQKTQYDGLKKKAEDVKKYITDNSLLGVVDNRSGGSGGGGGADKEISAYKAMLDKKKSMYDQYSKWLNSQDPILQKAAKTEFTDLLAEGKTYIDFLKNQRDQLMAIGKRSAEQNNNLADVNNAIAEATTETVVGAFEDALNTQLSKADTVLEKLSIIQEKRKELANEEQDPVNEEKSGVLDNAESEITKKAKEDADAIMTSYRLAVDYRLSSEMEYQQKMAVLRNAYNRENDAAMKVELQSAMDLLSRMHEAGITSFEDLESLNQESLNALQTFENKRMQIVAYYEPLIAAARIRGDKKAAAQLEGQRDMEIMTESKQYQDFFNDIQNLSIRSFEATRNALIKMVQEAFAAGKMTYDQYKQIIDKINNQADQAYKGRGMEAIFGSGKTGGAMNLLFGEGDLESKINSFKTIFSKPKADMAAIGGSSAGVEANAKGAAGAMKGAAGGAAGALAMVDAIITGVYQTINATIDVMGSVADMQESFGKDAHGLRDTMEVMSTINESVMGGWQKLKNGDVMGAMAETITMPMKLITVFNQIHDRKIERSIKRHQRAVTDLANAYNQLSWEIDKALGKDVYKYQQSAIRNMEEQQEHLRQMISDEERKKKTDHDRIVEFNEQIAELERQKQDMLAEIAKDITQTDAKTFADQLGDALVEAFGKGEDAAKAFNETVDDILRNAVLNMLKKQFLEKGLQRALENLENYMGYWNGDEFVFDGLTDAEKDSFKNQVDGVSKAFSEALKVYEDLFKKAEEDAEEDSLSGSGGIESVSEETATKIDGQMNAIRINQVEGIAIMRQQLAYLAQIEYNTSFCKYAVRLEQIYNLLNNRQTTSLRGQGLS